MKIDLNLVPALWYENADSERHVPSAEEMSTLADPPSGFIYQHSQFPNTLRHSILESIQADAVEACGHPVEDIRRTYGWIDAVQGRECVLCGGTQTRNAGDEWPETWESYGSRSLMSGESSWPEDLVLAMATKPWWKWWRNVYTLGDAILIVANTCERCLNALGHRYGLKWGYAEGSEEWKRSRTSCQFCKGD